MAQTTHIFNFYFYRSKFQGWEAIGWSKPSGGLHSFLQVPAWIFQPSEAVIPGCSTSRGRWVLLHPISALTSPSPNLIQLRLSFLLNTSLTSWAHPESQRYYLYRRAADQQLYSTYNLYPSVLCNINRSACSKLEWGHLWGDIVLLKGGWCLSLYSVLGCLYAAMVFISMKVNS